MTPAANCTDPVVLDIFHDNGRVEIRVELKWNGTSTPPNCDGTVTGVFWNNASPNTWYAHFPVAKGGPACYRIDPNASGSETRRGVLSAGGFDTRADVFDNLLLDQNPPGAGERLLN